MIVATIKNLRWYIAGLLCLASALNYLDRQTLSVLIGTIKDELHLTNASYGKINAWFLASYGVMYAVSGRVIDLIGTRRGFVVFVTGWSLANMMHMFATTVGQFSFFRLLLGVFEPGSFTGGVRAVSEWFPMQDRALDWHFQFRHSHRLDDFRAGGVVDRDALRLACGVSHHGFAGFGVGDGLVVSLQTSQPTSASRSGRTEINRGWPSGFGSN